jgi:hypothetical protein
MNMDGGFTFVVAWSGVLLRSIGSQRVLLGPPLYLKLSCYPHCCHDL